MWLAYMEYPIPKGLKEYWEVALQNIRILPPVDEFTPPSDTWMEETTLFVLIDFLLLIYKRNPTICIFVPEVQNNQEKESRGDKEILKEFLKTCSRQRDYSGGDKTSTNLLFRD